VVEVAIVNGKVVSSIMLPGSCKTPDEVDHRGRDLGRALLLGPVAASRQDDRGVQSGDEFPEIRDQPVDARKTEPCGFRARPVSGHAICRANRRAVRFRNARSANLAPICSKGAPLAAAMRLDAIPVWINREGGIIVSAIVRA
jgi:hypothetical protein